MKRTFQILFFCFTQMTIYCQQPETPLTFGKVQPKWQYYSYSSLLADSSQNYLPQGKPLIVGDDVYLLSNSIINFYQGPNVEKLNINTGALKATYQSFNKAINGRNAAYSLKKNGNFLDLYTFKENSYKETNTIYPFWGISNYNLLRLCENNLTICDSIITNPLDTNNKKIYMPALLNNFGISRNTHLFSYNNTTQYVFHYGEVQQPNLTSSAKFEVLTLDNKGYMTDSAYMEFPIKYSIKNIYLKEYDSNKYMALVAATDTAGNFENKILYFKKGFLFEREADLSSKLQKAERFNIPYYDNNYFIVAASSTKKINNVNTTFWSYYLFDHNAQLLEQIHLDGTPNTGGYATLLNPSRKIVTFEKKKVNKQAAIDFYISDGNNKATYTQTITTSRDITISGSYVSAPDNHVLLSFGVEDSSATKKYKDIPKWRLWAMFSPTSLNFTVRTTEISLPTFTFYPNPTNSQLTINTDESYDAIQLYSIEGKLMYQHFLQACISLNY